MSELRDYLRGIDACSPAIEWVGNRALRQAWDECENPEWLLWLIGHRAKTQRQRIAIVRTACAIARRVLHLIPAGEDRPRLAIEAAERWCKEPTEVNRRAAEAAAWAAAVAAAEAAAGAADAAWAARAAAWAAEAAARAAAWAAAVAAAGAAERRAICDLIRRRHKRPRIKWEGEYL